MTAVLDLDQPWRQHAACREADPELFFPEREDRAAAAAAKEVCRSCPVVSDCLQWAREHGQIWGIWGGQTPAERAGVVESRLCDHCGHPYTPWDRRQMYCCGRCSRMAQEARKRRRREGGR